jgi:hypothetical protein
MGRSRIPLSVLSLLEALTGVSGVRSFFLSFVDIRMDKCRWHCWEVSYLYYSLGDCIMALGVLQMRIWRTSILPPPSPV